MIAITVYHVNDSSVIKFEVNNDVTSIVVSKSDNEQTLAEKLRFAAACVELKTL